MLAAALALAVLSSPVAAWGQSPAMRLFDDALRQLETRYFGYARLDAGALRAAFAPRVEAACAGRDQECPFDAAAPAVDEMVASLGDPHTYRLPPALAAARERELAGQAPGPSVGLRLAPVPDAAAFVVTAVQAGGPAERAGLRRGDTVWSLAGQPLDAFPRPQAALDALRALEANEDTVRLDVSSPGGRRSAVELRPQAIGPWLPQLELRPDGVAVIAFAQFKTGGQVASRAHALVREAQARGARALILDVRDSAGGLVAECLVTAAAFVDPVVVLDEFRDGRWRFEATGGRFITTDPRERRWSSVVVPEPARWTGPVAVITNGAAKSAPEYLAFLVQRAGRGKVVGEPTLGALDTSNSMFELPDGSALAISLGRSLEPTGARYPARVTPDVPVRDDRAALAAGRDPPLEAAVRLLGTATPATPGAR